MLLINRTRAIEAFKLAGYYPEIARVSRTIEVGLWEFPVAAVIHGSPMYDQQAIIKFIRVE